MRNHVKWNVPNTITSLRIFGSIILLSLKPLSLSFFVIYTMTGATDVLDGWIARKTGTTSETGARLDSMADLFFYAVTMIQIVPILLKKLPIRIWYSVALIVVLRFSSYVVSAIKFHKFVSVHTYLNKFTGLAVFAVPYMICLPVIISICWAICAIGLLSSLEELFIQIMAAEYYADRKSIFEKGRKENLQRNSEVHNGHDRFEKRI
ncbi:CDP-alcohol phosphatidyltransferase family protein [Frisingicoccus sp.]|uniref:CDP-alcohol phosphatidyltransferase family protein n=1 Tax=Frisingicoccus sp. TaxID=1918627 RepID=UPI002EA524CB|nr:CDP-alcohol phosphatidyltransferase family protein [Frisingicoccus sp.]